MPLPNASQDAAAPASEESVESETSGGVCLQDPPAAAPLAIDLPTIQPRAADAESEPATYDRVFWFCYAANICMMVAMSLLFRYSDFVGFLGGSEADLGWIVGVGMSGAIVMRLVQGVAIDRCGPRAVWLASLAGFVLSMLLHLAITRVDGPLVYVVRTLMMSCVAGTFGASLTYISLRAPPHRMGEVIGMIGSSGFIGLAVGPWLGDWLAGSGAIDRTLVVRMFVTAALGGAVSWVFAAIATNQPPAKKRSRRAPPAWKLVRRYHPGSLLLVAFAMGIGIGLPNVFLKAYVQELGLSGIGPFFMFYAIVAFAVRVLSRRMADVTGVQPVIVAGLGSLAVSMLLYLTVWGQLSLLLPAALAGTAHAFLFPAVVSGGSLTFPQRYRGLATTLTLTMFDLGGLLGHPVIGATLAVAKARQLPAYPLMFCGMSAFLVLIAGAYLATTPRRGAKASV